MAEPGLSMKYEDYLEEVARVAGWLPPDAAEVDADSFDARTLRDLHAVMDSGLRQFYEAHEWTFLTPEARLYLSSGTSEYALPDNYDSMAGPLFYTGDSLYREIGRTTWDSIRKMKARYEQTGYPMWFAIVPVSADSREGTRWKIEVHPTPTQAWELGYRYRVLQEPLRASNPYPHGGVHSEAILASMLDILESRRFDETGAHRQRWLESLQFAIRRDSQAADSNLGFGATEPVEAPGRWPRLMRGLVQYQTPS